jgi:cytochrome c553
MTRGLETFQKQIRPLLAEHCVRCHGGEKTKGGFNLVTREDLLKGGDDGPAVLPFDAASSRLLKLVRHREEPHMPEKEPPLPEADIAKLAAWIDDGAPYAEPLVAGRGAARDRSVVSAADRQWWAFQPLAQVEPPPLQDVTREQNPVDRFVAAKAARKGLKLAPPADRQTLIRRASLDLLGLPPSAEEVEAFVRDPAPDAWPRLIQRLLNSPHYGERWGRHWLDLARFAESSGFEHDYDREGAFHYRDFVIRALNADLPYDQFVRWQLAGDEFDPDNPLALMATGFLGAGVFPTQITANEVERTRYDALDDMLATTGSAFLGLSIGCARCHDHKFDPIPTRDYYQMLATFSTTVRSVVDLDIDPARTRERLRRWEADLAPLTAEVRSYEAALEPRFQQWLQDGAPLPSPPTWTLLEITNATSQAGAHFKPQADGSSLVEGKNADEDIYTLTGFTSQARLTALRLEALADPSMQKGGPGRADNGNIGLSRIRVFAAPARGSVTQEVRLAKAIADFEQNTQTLSAASALDDNPKTGWAIDPQFGKDHAVLFQFAEPIVSPEGAALKVQLEFRLNTRHNIGRPRLAVTGEESPVLPGEALPAVIARWLARAGAARSVSNWPAADRAALFDWWKARDPGWRERHTKVEQQTRQKPDGRTKVLICGEGYPALRMHTQGADFFPETYFLKRGSTDLKAGVAPPGFLQVLMPVGAGSDEARWRWLPPEGAKFSGRRRALANWMTDTEAGAGALLARVAVNRLWQHHFGQGIVSTPSDFGHSGAQPTHPELLDWLATEFLRQGWRMKAMHQLLMTSATYQQRATPDAVKEKADPQNQLWTRRLPRRLEAEAVRDSILAVSGRLNAALYGPGSKDERSARRSIYFTVKRSQLIGSMVAFDQPEPLVSQGSRPVTTVAPQALFLLNAPQVREWARSFADRVFRETNHTAETAALVKCACEIALGRSPAAEETREAEAFLASQTASYGREGKADARDLAFIDYCQVLFGLNEFVYEP